MSEIRERPGLVSALAIGKGELKEASAAEAEAAPAEKLKAKHVQFPTYLQKKINKLNTSSLSGRTRSSLQKSPSLVLASLAVLPPGFPPKM